MPSTLMVNRTLAAGASPSITVCVPVYNVELYLRECLDSIFGQDYPNFDVVMIDDGSTDESGAICDEYAARFEQRAFVIHKDNEGPLLARRDGFARAAGDYVMCVDSDDALAPGAVSAVAAAITQTGADIIRFGFTRNDSELTTVPETFAATAYAASEKSTMLRTLCCSTSGSENPMCFKAVKRDCIGNDCDFSRFKGLTFCEDFLQTIEIYDRAETICFLDAVFYYYRPGSGITKAYDPHFYRDVCRCLSYAEEKAHVWESEYACDGLLAGLAACRLDSAAQYAEWMAGRRDAAGLDALRCSGDFARCAAMPGAVGYLRSDRRMVIGALLKRRYWVLRAVVRARAAIRRVRGAS